MVHSRPRSPYTRLTEATMADNPFEERAEPNPFQVRDDAASAPRPSAFHRRRSKFCVERVFRLLVMSPRRGCPARTRPPRLLASLAPPAPIPSHTLTCPRSLFARRIRIRA